MWPRLDALLGWALVIAGVAGILSPAFFEENISFTKAVLSLADPEISLRYTMRLLSAVVFISAIYIITQSNYYRNLPITVISTKINVAFEDYVGSRVQVSRSQLLRANEPKITAYNTGVYPTNEGGTVPKNLIKSSVSVIGNGLQNERELFGNEKRGFDFIHNFVSAMPFAWYMPLIPIWVLNRDMNNLFGFLGNKLVLRRHSAVYLNEFDGDLAVMQFKAQTYQQHNISLEIQFPNGPPPNELRAIRIKNSGVAEERFDVVGGNLYRLFIPSLNNETLRVSWKPSNHAQVMSEGRG